jgi:hypothetical protein
VQRRADRTRWKHTNQWPGLPKAVKPRFGYDGTIPTGILSKDQQISLAEYANIMLSTASTTWQNSKEGTWKKCSPLHKDKGQRGGGGMTTICDGLAMESLQNPRSPYKSWYNFERRLGLSDWRVLNTEFWPRRSNPRVERHNLNSVIQLPHTNSPATFQCKKIQHLCGRNQQCAPNHCEKIRTKGVMWESKALQQQQKRRV